MNNPTPEELKALKKSAKVIAKELSKTTLNHRGLLFQNLAMKLDASGDVALCQLFAKIAGTYMTVAKSEENKAKNLKAVK